MNRAELQKFFLLENNPRLFETALCPRSCGGGAKFEQLALYGDAVIDMHLLDYLINDFQQNGDLTKRKSTIHHENMIKTFADDLNIPDILTRAYPIYHPQNRDLAETVEALIGAAFQANGLDKCKPIIFTFAEFAQKIQETSKEQGEFDTSKNYIGKLNELFQEKHFPLPNLEPIRIGGNDHTAIFQFEGEVIFDGTKHEISTRPRPKKKLAEQEAAYLALCAITGNNPEYAKFDPAMDNIRASQEKTVHPTTSINDEELIFHKSGHQNTSMKADQDPGELLVDWVNRKAKENVFGMLRLLSSRLDSVSGASWTCEISSGVLALIHLQLGEENYFALGFGPSKTKARKAAGEDMLKKVNLTEWLNIHYPDHII